MYGWINKKWRSKAKTYFKNIESLNDSRIEYDGSSTEQAEGNNSEIILIPVALFRSI